MKEFTFKHNIYQATLTIIAASYDRATVMLLDITNFFNWHCVDKAGKEILN